MRYEGRLIGGCLHACKMTKVVQVQDEVIVMQASGQMHGVLCLCQIELDQLQKHYHCTSVLCLLV